MKLSPRLLSALVLLAAELAGQQAAHAQRFLRQLTQLPVSVPMIGSAPRPAAACNTCGEAFWIASSWSCNQHGQHCCRGGDLEIYEALGCDNFHRSSRDAFHASLRPGVPVCVVIHGSFTNWKGLCDDCAPVLRWIRSPACGRPLHVIFYTWPSNGPITLEPHLDVGILGNRASFNSVYLADLVARIPATNPVCIIGHSHGARMAVAGLHLLAGGSVDNVCLNYPPPQGQRVRTVLLAAALDHHWLNPGERFERALWRTEGILNLHNDHDIVLSLYPARRLFSRRAIGESGLTYRDRSKMGPLSERFVEMDVTQMIQTGHMWENYYRCPQLAEAISPYVYFEVGPDPPASNAALPPKPQ